MDPDFLQMMYLSQMFSGQGMAWVQVALLACLFAMMLFRPERIRSPWLFRWAGLFLAFSVIAPPVLWLCIRLFVEDMSVVRSPRPMASGGGLASLLSPIQMASGPTLLGLGIICGVFALGPRAGDASRAQPPRHPLE
ncbi:MAG: hypothetical protein NTW96_10765 [Planctomycetia bacterium]|nr:hypothetical protein [Planctomycetia bacterium]